MVLFSFQESNIGNADGEIGRIKGVDAIYPNLVIVDEPIIEARDFVAFGVAHKFAIDGWDSLKPCNAGYVRGWKNCEKNIVGAKSASAADSTFALFRMLQNGRVAVSARIDGLYTAKQIGLNGVRVLEPPLATLQRYLHLHREHADLAPKLARAIRDTKTDGSFYRIRDNALSRIMAE